jgi:hypothetical protein
MCTRTGRPPERLRQQTGPGRCSKPGDQTGRSPQSLRLSRSIFPSPGFPGFPRSWRGSLRPTACAGSSFVRSVGCRHIRWKFVLRRTGTLRGHRIRHSRTRFRNSSVQFEDGLLTVVVIYDNMRLWVIRDRHGGAPENTTRFMDQGGVEGV